MELEPDAAQDSRWGRHLQRLVRPRHGHHAEVTNEELFFDLVYVYAVTQLSHKLLHDISGWGVGETLVLWLGLWLGWQYTCWCTNWFDPRYTPMRICVLCLMALVLIMAASIPHAFNTDGEGLDLGGVFGGCLVGVQVGRTLFICVQLGLKHNLSKNHLRLLCWNSFAGAFWIAGACVGHNLRFGLWWAAIACDFISPMFGYWLPFLGASDTKTEWSIEGGHLTERCHLFVIISLGESLISSGGALTDAKEWDSYTVATFFATLLGTIAMWWLYFGTSSNDALHRITSDKNPGLVGSLYHYTHAVLILGIIVTAVGDDCAAEGPHEPAKIGQMLMISVGPIIYLAGSMAYKFVVYRSIAFSHLAGIVCMGAVMPIGYYVNMLSQSWLTTGVFYAICAWEQLLPQRSVECGVVLGDRCNEQESESSLQAPSSVSDVSFG